MAANTSRLKTFAQETRKKLISLITTKLRFVLTEDNAELRGKEKELGELRKQIADKGEQGVIEEVAYTWFNRVMALRFMDANGYNTPIVVSPVSGQSRPEILQEAMGGNIDEDLHLPADVLRLPEATLYRRLLIAICNSYSGNMPFLFEHISDYTELLLPDDLLSKESFVSDIVAGMTDEDCQDVEVMGWLYQFYITDKKADAEVKKGKKGRLKSDEQAAATQLFTPHWIVRYMVENSLGKIWMTLHPESRLVDEMKYFIPVLPGETDKIPEDIHSAKDIRFLDPCMGSGHILVYAFDLFTKMYEEEGYPTKEIPRLILENNLYGIDIDPRCYQLASFALTMKARGYYRRYLRDTVNPNVIALRKYSKETIETAGNWPAKSLMWQFENVDTIGSLLKITPEECAAIKVENGIFDYESKDLKRDAEYLSRSYHCVVTNPPYLGKGFCKELKDYVIAQYPEAKADLMATFMPRCLQFCADHGKMAMINMQSWMFQPTFESLRQSIISDLQINSLLHLGPRTFEELSGEIVRNAAFVITKDSCNKFGQYFKLVDYNTSNAKEEIYLEIISNLKAGGQNHSNYYKTKLEDIEKVPGHSFGYWISPNAMRNFGKLKLGDSIVPRHGLATSDNNRFLKLWFEVSYSKSSLVTKCDYDKKWFPMNKGGAFRKWYGNNEWVINYENDGEELKNFAIQLYRCSSRTIQNTQFYFKPSLTWSALTSGKLSLRWSDKGAIFGSGAHCAFADEHLMIYGLGVMNSNVFQYYLRALSGTMNINVDDIRVVPYIESDFPIISDKVKRNVSISRKDWDAHETSWDFKKPEIMAVDTETYMENIQYQVDKHFKETGEQICIDPAAPELDSLEWRYNQYQTKWERLFLQLHANEEELNRRFIEIYGLQDELSSHVDYEDITILQKGEISLYRPTHPLENYNFTDEERDNFIKAGGQILDDEGIVIAPQSLILWHPDVVLKQFISYLVGCFMGRYSVDRDGLIIASQGQNLADLGLEVDGLDGSPKSTLVIDDDGIIPIVMEEEFFADDLTKRITEGIKTLFGKEHFYANMKFIEDNLGCDLRTYLHRDYYNDHLDMYSVKGAKRPIYWLFSSKMGDKRKKGWFKALVYMHRLEPDTLSKLHADYVHPYIQKTEMQLREAEEMADRDDLKPAARNKALKQVEEIRSKLREMREFETQLVEMASQRLSIDLDDGVKANYPKFCPLVEPIKGLDSKDE